MQEAIFPNTFIIGVQKAGTTTLDEWLSQHPDIYCYETLKDVHLFARFKTFGDIEARLRQEPVAYKGEPVVLQSAVNYIFYPSMLQQIAQHSPKAKLILILRNPVQRAFSAYSYFTKMLREKRSVHEALMYKPKTGLPFSKDNNDFTYIEHGMYAEQIKSCLQYFPKEQLLVLDYEELRQPQSLLIKIFSFLGIDASFKPDLTPKNITGTTKSTSLQKGIIRQNPVKRFLIKYLVNPWMPVTKRKKLKAKLFEMNTGKAAQTSDSVSSISTADTSDIKAYLKQCYDADVKELDALLQTSFYTKWFADSASKESVQSSSSHA